LCQMMSVLDLGLALVFPTFGVGCEPGITTLLLAVRPSHVFLASFLFALTFLRIASGGASSKCFCSFLFSIGVMWRHLSQSSMCSMSLIPGGLRGTGRLPPGLSSAQALPRNSGFTSSCFVTSASQHSRVHRWSESSACALKTCMLFAPFGAVMCLFSNTSQS